MDASSFMRSITLFTFLAALPVLGSAAPPGGSAHVSGGGHAVGGARGQAVGGGGHSIGGARGQAVGGRDKGVGGGSRVAGGRNQAVIGARSSVGVQANANKVRRGTVQVAYSSSFRNGRGDWSHQPSDWKHQQKGWKDGRGDWKHGHGTAWHRDGNHHHRHHRVSFGFFPYWYPSGGFYSYGYPDYSYNYSDYYYPDNGYYSDTNDSGSIQVLVQGALARRGYYAGQIDGVIGPETESAIREFQRDNGLPATGRITRQLLQALNIA
jgi:hypothetical protein